MSIYMRDGAQYRNRMIWENLFLWSNETIAIMICASQTSR